jgi:hypothetical protein
MPVFGFGAVYDEGRRDVSDDFLRRGVIAIGSSRDDAPDLHEVFEGIKGGDFVYIKSTWRETSPPTLIIKAVGIVADDKVFPDENLGTCRRVIWIWRGDEGIPSIGELNIRMNSVYPEHHPAVRDHIFAIVSERLAALRVA